jgi:hypothetical protein
VNSGRLAVGDAEISGLTHQGVCPALARTRRRPNRSAFSLGRFFACQPIVFQSFLSAAAPTALLPDYLRVLFVLVYSDREAVDLPGIRFQNLR